MRSAMDALLDPRSIALIGASANAGRIGGLPLELLTRFGYRGDIYPVNPKYEEVLGLRCWPEIEAVPAGVDLAVLEQTREGQRFVLNLDHDCAE